VRVRRDSRWNVPEPELVLVLNNRMEIVGFTAATTSPRATSRARTRSTCRRPRSTTALLPGTRHHARRRGGGEAAPDPAPHPARRRRRLRGRDRDLPDEALPRPSWRTTSAGSSSSRPALS
jgi:hypothetical protein